MRICIDGTSLLLPSGGVKNYIYYWLQYLTRIAGQDSIQIYPMIHDLSDLDHRNSNLASWSSAVRLAAVRFANIRHNPILNLLGARLDLFHASNTHVRNPPTNAILTATLYDMSCWLLPESHSAANVAATRQFFDDTARRAKGFIAISENTRRDAVRILGLPPDSVEVIYPGVANAFFEVTGDAAQQARLRHGLNKPYVLYVGTIEPRKNVDTLLDAYQALRPSTRDEFDLVMAGSVGWAAQSTVDRLNSPPPGVRYLGYVVESDLPGLTAGATALAYPSLYEGFGLPVAQAMAAGVPVVASNVSCLPEISAGAALLPDPRSVAENAMALEQVLGSDSLRRQLATKGKLKATEYRWADCARRSLEFFHRMSGK